MGVFSWLRFIIGTVLSLEIIRSAIMGTGLSSLVIILAIVFVLLAVFFFIEKYVTGH